jgi:hypothetical protein
MNNQRIFIPIRSLLLMRLDLGSIPFLLKIKPIGYSIDLLFVVVRK